MLKAILLSSFLFIAATSGETYFIIRLKGGIVNKTTGKPLKMGDKINHDDQLKFLSQDAAAILMSTKRGRFTVKPNIAKSNGNELVAFVKNVLLPVKSSGNLSTRGGESDGIMDLKSHFGSGKYVVIGDTVALRLNSGKYPLNENKFFIYRYEFGGKAISKKITSSGDKILLDKKLLYKTPTDETVPVESVESVEVYYYDAQTKNSTLVSKFKPLYLNEAQVKSELKIQYDIFTVQNLPKEEVSKELNAYVEDVYGKTDEESLNAIISTL